MNFCPDCNNCLYALEETGEAAGFKCRKCPYVREITHDNPLVYEHNLREDAAIRLTANPYLKDDPTLQHFKTIQCPTKGCPSQDVVGYKLSVANLVWLYQCTVCNATWKQASRRS